MSTLTVMMTRECHNQSAVHVAQRPPKALAKTGRDRHANHFRECLWASASAPLLDTHTESLTHHCVRHAVCTSLAHPNVAVFVLFPPTLRLSWLARGVPHPITHTQTPRHPHTVDHTTSTNTHAGKHILVRCPSLHLTVISDASDSTCSQSRPSLPLSFHTRPATRERWVAHSLPSPVTHTVPFLVPPSPPHHITPQATPHTTHSPRTHVTKDHAVQPISISWLQAACCGWLRRVRHCALYQHVPRRGAFFWQAAHGGQGQARRRVRHAIDTLT